MPARQAPASAPTDQPLAEGSLLDRRLAERERVRVEFHRAAFERLSAAERRRLAS